MEGRGGSWRPDEALCWKASSCQGQLLAPPGLWSCHPPGDTASSMGHEQDWQGEEDTSNPRGCLRLPGLSSWVTMVRQGKAVLRSTLGLTILPHGATDTWDVQRTLQSTHWCPDSHRGHSCCHGRSDWGDFATWKILRWLQAEGEQGLGTPGRREQSVGWGGRSCSVLGEQLWSQEGIFPWDRLALAPRGFCLPLQQGASPLANLVPSDQAAACSHPRGVLVACTGRRKASFPTGQTGQCPWGFPAFLCSTEQGQGSSGPLWLHGCCSCSVMPRCLHLGGESFLCPQGQGLHWASPEK